MKKGTFNKIVRFGNLIIKLSTEHTSIANEMLKLDSRNIKKYENDISNVGINTSKVYLSICFNNKNFIIQEFINGETVQEYLDSNLYTNLDKLKMFKKVIQLYELSTKNDNLCLDWNLNNFIVRDNDIYYIDYVPALYKDKIKSVKSERLKQYKLSLLDREIQLAGIISYAIVPFFADTKEELCNVYLLMKRCIEEMLEFKININNNVNHVYIQKLSVLENYLYSNQSKEEFIKKYNSISMMKTAYVKKK